MATHEPRRKNAGILSDDQAAFNALNITGYSPNKNANHTIVGADATVLRHEPPNTTATT